VPRGDYVTGAREAVRGKAQRGLIGARTAARVWHGGATKATTPRPTGGVGDGSVRTVRWSAARHERLGGDRRGGDGRGRSASVVWCVGHARSEADNGGRRRAVGMRHGDGTVGRWLSGRRCAVPTVPLRHGVRHGAGTWQPHGDGTLTGEPLMSVIFELKFTQMKISQNK
jgi:hypothetical protein